VSMRFIRRMLCSWTGKVIHFTKGSAKQLAKHKGSNKFGYYKCSKCGKYHLYTKKKKT
jgi:hypothetical protein